MSSPKSVRCFFANIFDLFRLSKGIELDQSSKTNKYPNSRLNSAIPRAIEEQKSCLFGRPADSSLRESFRILQMISHYESQVGDLHNPIADMPVWGRDCSLGRDPQYLNFWPPRYALRYERQSASVSASLSAGIPANCPYLAIFIVHP